MPCAWTISSYGSMDTFASWTGSKLCKSTHIAKCHIHCWTEDFCSSQTTLSKLSYADHALLRGS